MIPNAKFLQIINRYVYTTCGTPTNGLRGLKPALSIQTLSPSFLPIIIGYIAGETVSLSHSLKTKIGEE